MTFIESIKRTDSNINLYKLNSDVMLNNITNATLFSETFKIGFLDLETTGTNSINDEIIEIAIKIVTIDSISGQIVSYDDQYESFQEPSIQITEKITMITGIDSSMVKGHYIDWKLVNDIVDKADVLVAHNATFDRSFLDKCLPLSRDKVWACSIYDINWLELGFVKSSLELLSIWHGFYYDSHRAMNDVDALIHLVTHPSYDQIKPVVELIKNSQIPYYEIIASGSPFETKDILKSNQYRWNPNKKFWFKRILKDEINNEKIWLTDKVYKGFFKGIIEEVSLQDKYKK